MITANDRTASEYKTLNARATSGGFRVVPASDPKRIGWRSRSMGAVLLAAVVGIGWWGWMSRETPASTSRQRITHVKSVTVVQPTDHSVGTVVLPATIRPWQAAILSARVSGYLAGWHADLGAHVKAGELLAEIDTPELDQELSQAKAMANEAAAAAKQAVAERVEAEAELKVATAKLASAQAESDLADQQLDRRRKLLGSQATTQEQYDTFSRSAEARHADLDAAHSEVVRLQANLQTRSAIIQSRQATVDSQNANVQRLEETLKFKRIVAPFDGVVTRRTAEVGMLVTAGKEPLFVVEDTSRLRVQLNVPQTYSAQTQPGTVANVSLPESALAGVSGTITRVAQSVDPASRTMLAEVELDNRSSQLQPGSYVRVTLELPQVKGWTIPANTVQMQIGGPRVALVNEQQQIQFRKVSLGRDLGTQILVRDGIAGDEHLVVNPTADLKEGLAVQVEPTAKPARHLARQ